MQCKKCGQINEEGAKFCGGCGSALDMTETTTTTSDNVEENVEEGSANQSKSNSLVGKEYEFRGGFAMLHSGRVYYHVVVQEDRLLIDSKPKRKVKIPVAMLEDITAIEEGFYMSPYTYAGIVLSIALTLIGAIPMLLYLAFLVIFCRERRIKIHLKNGGMIPITACSQADTETFIDDMKQITNIQ